MTISKIIIDNGDRKIRVSIDTETNKYKYDGFNIAKNYNTLPCASIEEAKEYFTNFGEDVEINYLGAILIQENKSPFSEKLVCLYNLHSENTQYMIMGLNRQDSHYDSYTEALEAYNKYVNSNQSSMNRKPYVMGKNIFQDSLC